MCVHWDLECLQWELVKTSRSWFSQGIWTLCQWSKFQPFGFRGCDWKSMAAFICFQSQIWSVGQGLYATEPRARDFLPLAIHASVAHKWGLIDTVHNSRTVLSVACFSNWILGECKEIPKVRCCVEFWRSRSYQGHTCKVGVLEFIQKGNSHALTGNCMALVRFVQWPKETEMDVLMPNARSL